MEIADSRFAMLVGALVADAAALGWHWLYEPGHVQAVAGDKPEFYSPDSAHYADVKGYFAHAGKSVGALSQYGETLRVAVQSIVHNKGQLVVSDFQQHYRDCFGPGGRYQGYIDRPTRGTLNHLADADPAAWPQVSGVDDEQIPALSTLPALVAADRLDAVTDAVKTTHDNDFAVRVALAIADVLNTLLNDTDLSSAIIQAASSVESDVKALLLTDVESAASSCEAYAETVGRACQLVQTVPLLLYIARHTTSYSEAIRQNILVGGDSCGRAIVLGAMCGLMYGAGGSQGIPYSWLMRLQEGAAIGQEIDALVSV